MRKSLVAAIPAAFLIVGCSASPTCDDGGTVYVHHTVTHHVVTHRRVTSITRPRISLTKRR